MAKITITKSYTFSHWPTIRDGIVSFCVTIPYDRSLTINIYDRTSDKKEFSIDIPDNYRVGDQYSFALSGIDFDKYSYCFYDGKLLYADPYSVGIYGTDKWGSRSPRSAFPTEDSFDWGEDTALNIPFEDVILYTAHVRGFTKDKSSGVKARGTFEGMIEKIPYLAELGVNQIELMPVYDFDELIKQRGYADAENTGKVNYWGYSDEAFYFSPKAAYSDINNSRESMKKLVKALHSYGIEVVLQFYFAKDFYPEYIISCLKYWLTEYHIDGACLMGANIPSDIILNDSMLAAMKIYLWGANNIRFNGRRRLGIMQDDYMCDMRKFLKSDEDMLKAFSNHIYANPSEYGLINNITNYYGFTLMDLVSYDRKHNEENGEDNRDGSDHNFSWNCGVEGPSRKKAVINLRRKQIFNALFFLYTSAGVPKLVMGDEFGNSQKGNNNPYCQDNQVTWLNWKDLDKNKAIYEFTKKLIAYRKKSRHLSSAIQKSMMDKGGTGYPDLSFHGEQAWYPRYESYYRSIGCMYNTQDMFIYTGYNMYWGMERLALPKLPKSKKWYAIFDTKDGFYNEPVLLKDQEYLMVPDRSCILLEGLEYKEEK